MTQTYQARYRLRIGESWREPGELVPEAVTWFRVDSLVHHGRLIKVDVADDTLAAAVARYCPDLADEITEAPQPVAVAIDPTYPNIPPGHLSDIIGTDAEAAFTAALEADEPMPPPAEPAQPRGPGVSAPEPVKAAPAKAAPAKRAPAKTTPRKRPTRKAT